MKKLTLTPLSPIIGATVEGIDLNAIRSDDIYEELKAALAKHHVLFFRNQPAEPSAFLRLGAAFGDVERHDFLPHVPDFPQITILGTDGKRSPDTDYWHADQTFRAEPNLVGVLRAAKLPDGGGGDTLWANMAAVFEALPTGLQNFLLELEAEHDILFFLRRTGHLTKTQSKGDESDLVQRHPPRCHPVVIEHPVTGRRTLFVNSVWTRNLSAVDLRLAGRLLDMLLDFLQKPEFHVRFRWEKDSIAIWDNFATQHYATFDYAPHRREMHRMACGSARPKPAKRH